MSIAETAASLREDFEFLDDWEARYAHIIDLGKALPPLAEADMSDATKVRGCASQVWLVSEPSELGGGRIRYRGASDALIVSGLVALLLQLYSDEAPQEIIAFDAEAFFTDIGIDQALSPQRSNGLRSMLERIRTEAKEAV